MSLNNPIGSQEVFNYGGHTTDNLGEINNSPGQINPSIQGGGNFPSTVADLQGKYNYDIHDLVTSRHREDFPTLTIAELNGGSHNSVIYPFSEDYDGDFQFPETLINDLRTSDPGIISGTTFVTTHGIGGANEIGGKMQWYKALHATAVADLYALRVPAATGTSTNLITAGAGSWAGALNEKVLETYGSDKVLALGFELGSNERILGGTPTNFITKMIALLKGMNYTQRGGNGEATPMISNSTENFFGFVHDTHSKTVHWPMNDIAFNVDATDIQEHEIVVRVEAFWYDTTASQFVVILNFSKTNLDTLLGTVNTILLEEVQKEASTVTGGYTRFDTQLLLGMYNTVPAGVKEGSSANSNLQTGFQYAFESKENYMQIFRADPMEITGTRLASGNYRIDDVKRNRDKMLFLYKKDKANAIIWGKKSQVMGSDSKPVRTMSGILDYELNPIKYMRASLSSTADTAEEIKDFVDDLAYSLHAFKPRKGNPSTSMMCSHMMLRRLDRVVKLSYGDTTRPNVHGYTTSNPYTPGTTDFGIKHFDFNTAYGNLKFMHEPMLDFMTEFQLPTFLVGTGVNPKHIMLAIDKQYLSIKTLRGDKLQGNIQGNDEDLSREDIIGEHTLETLYPKNHAIILVDLA